MRTLSYLDAGTTSMVASFVVGAFASIVLFFKAGGRKFGTLFSPKKRKEAAAARAMAEELQR